MTNSNKKVLLITDSFPPRSGGASMRMQGLAKYLPLYGWDPTVLTVDLPGEPDEQFRVIQVPYPGDVTERLKRKLGLNPKKGLQKQLGIPERVSTTKKPITGKILKLIEGWISFPDQKKLWHPVAVDALRNLISREDFDILVSSSPPVVAHLIANKVALEFSIPWIADFRDLWTGNHYYPYGPIRKLFERSFELQTLASASRLVTVSKPLSNTLKSLHKEKVVVSIPNGFDPDEKKIGDIQDIFSITYTGQLYLGKRDPELLFKVVGDLLREKLIQDDVVINFYGEKVYWVDKLINKYSLEGIAFQNGVVDRAEMLKQQRSSQILLSLNWDNPQEEGVYTGKLFEYLAAQRPILALGGPRGVVSDLLTETNTGIHLRDEGELRQAILSWYEEYRQKGYVSYQGNEKILNYGHDKMAERFSEVLNGVSQSAVLEGNLSTLSPNM